MTPAVGVVRGTYFWFD